MSANSRVVAIIQARMNSKRLQNKSLLDLAGKPLIRRVLDRVQSIPELDQCLVATSSAEEDNPLAEWCKREGILFYRGSEEDVLDRFYQAARQVAASLVVRVTADDPFKDPGIYSRLIQICHQEGFDYASNTIRPTYPEGLDAEVFTFWSLQRAWNEARLKSEREHVTPYMWGHPELFQLYSLEQAEDLSYLRWTVDYEEDLEFAREIYRQLQDKVTFKTSDLIELLKQNPELTRTNVDVVRNEGYQQSLISESKTKSSR